MALLLKSEEKLPHTAILARSLEIPAVSGFRGIFQHLTPQSQVLINANTGDLIIDPSPAEIESFQEQKKKSEANKILLMKMKGQASITKDGRTISLVANIGTALDLPSVFANDAEGVGLYRTEFVFLDKKTLPTEEEQFLIYRQILIPWDLRNALFAPWILAGIKPVKPCHFPTK